MIPMEWKKVVRKVYSRSIQKRLGYADNTKLLIIHADDLGLSLSENSASIEALKIGIVTSGSVMVPCAGFEGIANFARNNPEADIGIHLTLTSEWNEYKWGPIAPAKTVESITDRNGCFLSNNKELKEVFLPEHIEYELRSQINKALEAGIDITHIDSHMFVAFSDPAILRTFNKLAKEFRLPLLLRYSLPLWFLAPPSKIIVDNLYYARSSHLGTGLKNYYSSVLTSLKPGLNCILIHPSYDTPEMQQLTSMQSEYGSKWRQEDFDFFTGEECRELINRNSIHLITWREIRDKLIR